MVTHSTFTGFAMTRAAWFFLIAYLSHQITTLINKQVKRLDLGLFTTISSRYLRIAKMWPMTRQVY